jgi:deoxyribose-phosphate aldolase
MSDNLKNLAHYIDHTLLRPDAKKEEIEQLCQEALDFSFRGVCVERKWLSVVVPRLAGTNILPVTVIGFPRGSESTNQKCEEAQEALRDGALELDMVLNRVLLKQKNYSAVYEDIHSVVRLAGSVGVKVILETSELSREEILAACVVSKSARASFVKTSTGFSKGGARSEDVALMRSTVANDMGVKASGGIRTLDDAVKMIRSGASRLGLSASIAIVTEAKTKGLG